MFLKRMMNDCRTALLMLCVIFSASSYATPSDYLPPDLRVRVEQLKADLDTIPTSRTNVKVRAELTWQWLNAYALDGGYLPVDATHTVASVIGEKQTASRLLADLNATIRELTLLDDHPQALGQLSAHPGPFTAGSTGTITQTYTVAEREIQTGGGIMVARHHMTDFGAWQATEPDAPNYISIRSSNPRVSFVATTVPVGGMHGGLRNTRPTLVFKVASGTLTGGDSITLTYGDTSAGSPGLTMPSFSSNHMPLPLYVKFTDKGQYFSLPIQPIRITGGTVAGVSGFAPSIVQPGETFTFSIRARDRFFNRAQKPIPDWRVSKNGEPWLEVQAEQAITLTQATIKEPGIYYLSIASKDGTVQGEVNPILVTEDSGKHIYWGDTNGHSGFSEGIGSAEQYLTWAKDDARLDFVTHSEHDAWLDDREWAVLRDNVRQFTREGEFIAYLGYEWTENMNGGGHHNVLFRNPDNRQRIPVQFYPTLSSLYQGLRNTADPQDILVIPHAHQAGDYRMSDPELESLVEISSEHGNFEWLGQKYLEHGRRIGFIAASDNHLSQPGVSAPATEAPLQRGGLGAVLAQERTSNAIFDSMKQSQSYATTGERIILDFSVNGTGMGQRAEFSETREIHANIIGTAPIENVTLIKNDKAIWQKNFLDNTGDRLAKEDTFLLSFSSASEPYHSYDNPRGWRGWEGTLEVLNATLLSIEPMDAGFPLQSIPPARDNPNRVTFSTKTRGDTSSYVLKLANIQRATRIEFDLVETLETGASPPFYRPAQRVPADSFTLNLRDLQKGRVIHTQTVDGYADRTTLRRLVEEGSREAALTFTDNSDKHGDFYFIRVVQSNDAIAWSSPVWVGGHDSR